MFAESYRMYMHTDGWPATLAGLHCPRYTSSCSPLCTHESSEQVWVESGMYLRRPLHRLLCLLGVQTHADEVEFKVKITLWEPACRQLGK